MVRQSFGSFKRPSVMPASHGSTAPGWSSRLLAALLNRRQGSAWSCWSMSTVTPILGSTAGPAMA